VHLAEEKEPMANIQVRYFDAQPENLSVATVVRKGAHRSELTQEFQRTLERLLGRPAKQAGN